MNKLLFCVLLIFAYSLSNAQEKDIQKDTAKVYRNIENYSKKRKFTHYIHKLIFEPVAKQKIRKSSFQKIKKTNFTAYEGKIIRNLKIITLDPFGYSDIDTTKTPRSFLAKFGNVMHAKTTNLAIRNLLLYHRYQRVDSLLVKESERLIRSQRFISSITTYFELVAIDSVDVSIRILDAWSLVPDVSLSSSKSIFYITEKNFWGTGHELANSYTNSFKSHQNGYNTNYSIPSILHTYIHTHLVYALDVEGNYAKSIQIERPFFSPYARWGAGVHLGQNLTKITAIDATPIHEMQDIKYNFQDYWAGHSFQIFKGNSEYNRGTNLITSARYFTKNYTSKPEVNATSPSIYYSEKLYLVGIGISSRTFTQDKYIFDFKSTEDVASGFVYNLTTGYQKKYTKYQFYTGARIAMGGYFEFGYLSGNLEYGTFSKVGKSIQSTSVLKLVYFTNLQELGPWKFRQFIKPQLIFGNNRFDSNSDKLTLNGETGINGFSNESLFGTKKILLNLQTQGYSPWRVLGFRLNPYFSYTGGMLGQKDIGFKQSKLYSQLSLGVIISNDYLVFNSFQFSISFYPNNPDSNSLFKTNAISTSNFGLQGFEISQPVLVDYR